MLQRFYVSALFISIFMLPTQTFLANDEFYEEEHEQILFEEKMRNASQKFKDQLARDIDGMFSDSTLDLMLKCGGKSQSIACQNMDAMIESLEERLGDMFDLCDPWIIAFVKANGIPVKYTIQDCERAFLQEKKFIKAQK